MIIEYELKESSSVKEAFQILVKFQRAFSLKDIKDVHFNHLDRDNKKIMMDLLSVKVSLSVVSETLLSIGIPKAKASDVLYKLALSKSLYFQGEKIIYDPFSLPEFSYVVDYKNCLYYVAGLISSQNVHIYSHECDLIFEGDRVFYFYKKILTSINSNCDFLWINKVQKMPLELTKESFDKLQWDMKLDDLSPRLTKISNIEIKETIACKPFLKLLDRRGVYASLWFDYGDFGSAQFKDNKKLKIQRNFEEETAWEKDLFETSYVSKKGPFFSYYCPAEKVSESVRFLVEIGWKVFNLEGKEVKLLSKKSLFFTENFDHFLLQGDLSFDEYSLSLDKAFEASSIHESFVNLSDNAVGLLEGVSFFHFLKMTQKDDLDDKALKIPFLHSGILEQIGDVLTDEMKRMKKSLKKNLVPKNPSKLFSGSLMTYQKIGLDWLSFLFEMGFGGILADEMGLGKTVQVLAFLAELDLTKYHMIVVPTSLKVNWERECQKFLNIKAHIFNSQSPEIKQGITIISFGLLRNFRHILSDISFDTVIVDEAQGLKNPDTHISKALCSLTSRFKLCITGTPIENKALDLWALFKFLHPSLLGSKKDFESMQKDSLQRLRLSKIIAPYVLRRKKEEVHIDLPQRVDQNIYIEMSNEEKSLYQSLLSSSKGELNATSSKLQIFEILLRLRQICCHPLLINKEIASSKLEQLLYDVKEILQEKRKVVIFSQFTSMLSLIRKAFQSESIETLYLDGATVHRQSIVDEFQNGDIPVFLISLKAGGTGLNITKADYVIIYDPWWNDAVEEQAIARSHRIGRKETVFVRRYIMVDSIEEKIRKLKELKKEVFSEFIHAEDIESGLTAEEVVNLLN